MNKELISELKEKVRADNEWLLKTGLGERSTGEIMIMNALVLTQIYEGLVFLLEETMSHKVGD